MIVDSLKGFERYLNIHSKFSIAYEFIRKSDFSILSPGKFNIDGNSVICTIWEGEAKGIEIPPLEVHDSYIDIHILLEGTETIGHKDRSRCSGENIPYDSEKDIAFFDESPDNFINLSPGNIAVMFPYDAHAPLIGEGTIKKAIIKIAV